MIAGSRIKPDARVLLISNEQDGNDVAHRVAADEFYPIIEEGEFKRCIDGIRNKPFDLVLVDSITHYKKERELQADPESIEKLSARRVVYGALSKKDSQQLNRLTALQAHIVCSSREREVKENFNTNKEESIGFAAAANPSHPYNFSTIIRAEGFNQGYLMMDRKSKVGLLDSGVLLHKHQREDRRKVNVQPFLETVFKRYVGGQNVG